MEKESYRAVSYGAVRIAALKSYIINKDDKLDMREKVVDSIYLLMTKGWEEEDAMDFVSSIVSKVRDNYGD